MVCEQGGRGCSRLLSGLTPRYPDVCVAVSEGVWSPELWGHEAKPHRAPPGLSGQVAQESVG